MQVINKGFKNFFEFILAPLVIFITALLIFLFFNWLFSGETSTEKLLIELTTIKSAKRWRIAYDLATIPKHLNYIKNNSSAYIPISNTLKEILSQYSYTPQSGREQTKKFTEYLIYLLSFCNHSAVNLFLKENLLSPDNSFLNVTILAIGNTKRVELVDDIIKIYDKASLDTQVVILYVLGLLHTQEGMKLLIKEFDSNDNLKKLNSAFALARIKEKIVLPYFMQLLKNENYKTLEIKDKGITRRINEAEEVSIVENILKSLSNYDDKDIEGFKDILLELERKVKHFIIQRQIKGLRFRLEGYGRR